MTEGFVASDLLEKGSSHPKSLKEEDKEVFFPPPTTVPLASDPGILVPLIFRLQTPKPPLTVRPEVRASMADKLRSLSPRVQLAKWWASMSEETEGQRRFWEGVKRFVGFWSLFSCCPKPRSGRPSDTVGARKGLTAANSEQTILWSTASDFGGGRREELSFDRAMDLSRILSGMALALFRLTSTGLAGTALSEYKLARSFKLQCFLMLDRVSGIFFSLVLSLTRDRTQFFSISKMSRKQQQQQYRRCWHWGAQTASGSSNREASLTEGFVWRLESP